ncbi:SDR family oxidoreductase [Luteolibacter arcticus]|uniref:SDR family oxidoreductase n=1 Tax=Luteolibacter arcticus TaxID=1581411 RepID=A0ABT3GI24_9BACT|nr:SDR family oxidoreductase [Luteolibacter arcticus]MCW1923152.1 SDR family oxidoreductase [Luteolibacter arcticus]
MHLDLSDKTILITGGLGPISEFIVKALDAAGATVVVTDREPDAVARKTLEAWGLPSTPYLQMDVTDHVEVSRAVDSAFVQYPGINIALGHAGGTGVFPFETCDQENFDRIVAFNFLAQTYFARSVLSHWRTSGCVGHLIFTSSYVAQIPMEGISAYVASKAALEMFAKNLALEYAKYQIRVNCVSPGNVAAGSSKLVYDNNPEYRAWVDRVSPLGKRNSPGAIANAFLYLCSSLAEEVDGFTLRVDAGVGLPKLG